jgi:hypothetical protein
MVQELLDSKINVRKRNITQRIIRNCNIHVYCDGSTVCLFIYILVKYNVPDFSDTHTDDQ